MSRPLKLWNGRGGGGRGHYYLCATTKRAAARLIAEYEHPSLIKREDFDFLINQHVREISVYFSDSGWGTPMDGITPEPGLWHSRDNREKPVKVL